MLSFLDFLGTIGGAVLGIPGILGLALGMTTRWWSLAAPMGLVVGLAGPLIFGGAHATYVTTMEFAVSAVIGIAAALTGCLIRCKGATV
ncbi:hypothetical protein ACQ5SO_20535 [Rhodovulum sp. DZ06]|uniref:hypothetical protein n=1 Tax=Rhodovulum sp. DZ06 TaxID=3425126 RepID=UPI003D32DE92